MPRIKKQKNSLDKLKIDKNSKKFQKKLSDDKKSSFYQAVGRRKESTARVKLFLERENDIVIKDKRIPTGTILINYRPIEEYFPGEINKKIYLEPFRVTNTLGRFTVSAVIEGGGLSGQLGAFIHGVSRALEKVDKEKYRPILKKKSFLTRDPRMKERRKAGLAQKARAKKQSPKR